MEDIITLDVMAPPGTNSPKVSRLLAMLLTQYSAGSTVITISVVTANVEMVIAHASGLPDDEAYEDLKEGLRVAYDKKYRVHVSERHQGKRFEAPLQAAALH